MICAVPCIGLLAAAAPVRAQRGSDDIGAQGTLAFSAIWNTEQSGAVPSTAIAGLPAGEARFSGRAGLRVAMGLFVGASVTSWQFNVVPGQGSDAIAAVSESVNLAPYVQCYPSRHAPLFLRAGLGLVNTWTYYGAGHVIQGFTSNHLTASGGIGIDLPVRAHLAISLSADYVRVFGAMNLGEAESAALLGIGLTVR